MNKKARLHFVVSLLAFMALSTILPNAAWAVCDDNSSTGDCLRELSKILPKDENLKQKAMTQNEANRENAEQTAQKGTAPAGQNIRAAKFSGLLNNTQESSDLFVVCDHNETVLYMEWHHPVARFGTLLPLTYQIDRQTAETTEVIALSEAAGETQFLEAMPLAKKLLDAKTFSASMVNSSGERLTALFDTQQAANALASVREACHW